MLIASPAVAQKKPGGGQKPQPPAAGAAAGGSTEIELDEPAKPAEPAPTDATPSTGGGGICEIDPSACPKELDVNAAAKKDVNAERYAVQQIYAYRARRFEIQPYWAFTLNDQFVSHPGPGLALNYYITHALAVGINGNLYAGLNGDSDFNFQNRRATRVAVPLNEYAWSAGLNFTYVPIYGKFAGFGNFIFHYDMYVVGGVGAISTRPIPVIDPDNRKFEYAPKLSIVNPGIGLRVFINRWFSANLEVRDYIYNETLESLTVGTTQAAQQDPKTWTGENRLTNHVQAQVGISVFLPFSWDYRLPK
ncbi:MAG: outer membrane beta-barrel domain-containing protein [Polyangiaceae bacterium]